jgi:hypothetical protein
MIARIIAWGLALAALLAGAYALVGHIEQRGYDRAADKFTAAIHHLQADAANTLADQVSKTRAAEQALHAAKHNQEIQDAKHIQTIAAYADRLRAAAGPAGRLRDPHAPQCGGSGDRPPGDPAPAAAAGATNRAEAGGLLSAELSELLRRLAREADEINAAYASCRADAVTVRSTP